MVGTSGVAVLDLEHRLEDAMNPLEVGLAALVRRNSRLSDRFSPRVEIAVLISVESVLLGEKPPRRRTGEANATRFSVFFTALV